MVIGIRIPCVVGIRSPKRSVGDDMDVQTLASFVDESGGSL